MGWSGEEDGEEGEDGEGVSSVLFDQACGEKGQTCNTPAAVRRTGEVIGRLLS